MAISVFAMFLRKQGGQIKAKSFLGRGPLLAKAFRALPKQEIQALATAAKSAQPAKVTKVRRSVLTLAAQRGLPVNEVRNVWFNTKGTTTIGRLRTISEKCGVKMLTPTEVKEALRRRQRRAAKARMAAFKKRKAKQAEESKKN